MERFLEQRDETAFAAIVTRHGPMVLGVCHRIIGTMHDAEDAFQATFLLLAQKAAQIIPGDAVGPWLHGVACRVALKSRTMLRRRQRHERLAAQTRSEGQVESLPHADLRSVLDQELQRLPRPYRLLVILCDLQGGTFRQVARQLQLPVGTLSGRLKRGRELLAERLARRGIALSTMALALMLTEQAIAQVPALWVASTARAAVAWIVAEALVPGLVGKSVVTLVKGTAAAMIWNHLKLVSSIVLCALILSAGWLLSSSTAQDKPENVPSQVVGPNALAAPAKQNKPQYLVHFTLYEWNVDKKQFDVVASPQVVVHPNIKATVHHGGFVSLHEGSARLNNARTGFEAEVEVKNNYNNELFLHIKAQETRSRVTSKNFFSTLTHTETSIQECKLSEAIDLCWEPFGKQGKLQVKVVKVESAPPQKQEPIPEVVETRVFPLKWVDAAGVVTTLQQLRNHRLHQIAVDTHTNSVIVQGGKDDLARCETIIKNLDQPTKEKKAKPPEVIKTPRLTVIIGEEFQLDKVFDVAKYLNRDKPKVELEYDHSTHQLSIKVLVDNLTYSDLSTLLEAGKPNNLKR